MIDLPARSARPLSRLLFIAGCIAAAQPAFAQTAPAPGPYAVARAGVQVDSSFKTDKPAPKTTAPLPTNIDGKTGFNGELGLGYDFGHFRLESAVGYSTASLNADKLTSKTNVGSGRAKSLDLGVSGYFDFNPSGRINPFVGGGIGASRVDLTAETTPRTQVDTPGTLYTGTRVKQSDWGFRWHLDAGLGFQLQPNTTLELAGRYTQTTSLDFKGLTPDAKGIPSSFGYKPRQSATSVLVGIRQRF